MSLRLTYLKEKGYVADDGDLRHTKVTSFCLAMFDIHTSDFGGNLLNVHIDAQSGEHPYLFIIVLNKDEPILVEIMTKVSSHDCFDSSFADDDNNELVFRMRVPDVHVEDYHKIIAGKYSKISEAYKNLLISNRHYGGTMYDLNDSPLIVNGQVATTMAEILKPSLKKREIVANHFGVEVSSIVELITKPNLDYEVYKRPNELFNK